MKAKSISLGFQKIMLYFNMLNNQGGCNVENRALFIIVSFVVVITQISILFWIFHVTGFSEDSDSLALYITLVIANIVLMLGLAVRYIADRSNSENNLYARCSIWIRRYFSLLIGVVVALTIMVLSSADKINLHTQPIFYSGMLTMGLGMVATIFTVHGKIPENSRLSNALVQEWNSKLKMCLFMPLVLMLFSGVGLLGIPTEVNFFVDSFPAFISGLALASWLYVTDFSLAVIDLNTRQS